MKEVMAFIAANPEIVAIGLMALESLLMPFIPIKWNGIAVLVIRFVKAKYAKNTGLVANPAKVEEIKSAGEQAKLNMQKAVDDYNKDRAADKLVQ